MPPLKLFSLILFSYSFFPPSVRPVFCGHGGKKGREEEKDLEWRLDFPSLDGRGGGKALSTPLSPQTRRASDQKKEALLFHLRKPPSFSFIFPPRGKRKVDITFPSSHFFFSFPFVRKNTSYCNNNNKRKEKRPLFFLRRRLLSPLSRVGPYTYYSIVEFPFPTRYITACTKKARRDSPPDVPPVQLGEVDQVRPEPVHQGAEGQPVPPGGAHVLNVHPGVAGHLPGAPEEKWGGTIFYSILCLISRIPIHVIIAVLPFIMPYLFNLCKKKSFCILHVLHSVFLQSPDV